MYQTKLPYFMRVVDTDAIEQSCIGMFIVGICIFVVVVLRSFFNTFDPILGIVSIFNFHKQGSVKPRFSALQLSGRVIVEVIYNTGCAVCDFLDFSISIVCISYGMLISYAISIAYAGQVVKKVI